MANKNFYNFVGLNKKKLQIYQNKTENYKKLVYVICLNSLNHPIIKIKNKNYRFSICAHIFF